MSHERHLDAASAEAYVLGSLGAPDAAWVEAHASQCTRCAGILAAEARLEEKLYQLAEPAAPELAATARAAPRRRLARWAARGVLGAAALAAMAVLVVGASMRGYPSLEIGPEPASRAARAVTCLGEAERCDDALARGLVVQYPALGAVPRYEGDAVPNPAHLARAPHPL